MINKEGVDYKEIKQAILSVIPDKITDVIHGDNYMQGRKDGWNIAIDAITKAIKEA